MKVTTPKMLNFMTIVLALCALMLCIVVRNGFKQYQKSTDVVGKSATSGIVAAQTLKVELARMHGSFAKDLVNGATTSTGFQEARRGVDAALMESAKNIHFGIAEKVPLQRLQYVIPKYLEAVDAALAESSKYAAAEKAAAADKLMTETLLPMADQLDEANQTAMNNAYDEQAAANKHVTTYVLIVGLLLTVLLFAAQVYLFLHFRRWLNPALATAAGLTLCFTIYAAFQFSSTDDHLRTAKEDVFSRMHVMWRAEARAEEAHADLLLKQLPGAYSSQFNNELQESLLRVLSQTPRQPATGYLANLQHEKGSVDDNQALTATITSFGSFSSLSQLDASKAEQSFTSALSSLNQAKQANDDSFQQHTDASFSALSSMEFLAIAVALSIAALSFFGIRLRAREYQA